MHARGAVGAAERVYCVKRGGVSGFVWGGGVRESGGRESEGQGGVGVWRGRGNREGSGIGRRQRNRGGKGRRTRIRSQMTKQKSHTLVPFTALPGGVYFLHRAVVVVHGCDGRVAHVVGGFEQAGGPGC